MANSTRCGYCQKTGHQKRKCAIFHGERKRVWDESVGGRKSLVRLMAETGCGNGAIIAHAQWSKKNNYLVLDPTEAIADWEMLSFKRVKYSKRVTLFSNTSIADGYGQLFEIPVLDLAANQQITINIYHKFLVQGGWKEGYEGWGSMRILSPSYDECDIADEVFEQNIPIAERLAVKEELEVNKYYPKLNKQLIIDPSKL
jgi:hypothetical protein